MRRAAGRARKLSWWTLGFAALGAAFAIDEAAQPDALRDFATNTGTWAAAGFLGFVLLMVASAALGALADILDALDGDSGVRCDGRAVSRGGFDKAALKALGEADEPLPLRDVAARIGLAASDGEQMRLAEELKRRGWSKRRVRRSGRKLHLWHPPGA